MARVLTPKRCPRRRPHTTSWIRPALPESANTAASPGPSQRCTRGASAVAVVIDRPAQRTSEPRYRASAGSCTSCAGDSPPAAVAAAARALVADDDHVARLDRAPGDGGHRVLLALEDARRTAVGRALVAGHLHHAALGGEVAPEDDEAAGRLERPLERRDDLLPGRLDRAGRLLGEGAAARRERASVDQAGGHQALPDHGAAARVPEVDRGEPAPRLQVGPHRRAAAHAVEIVDRERHADLAREREEVEDRV